MAEGRMSARKLQAKERALEASKLKLAGASVQMIADKLGVTRQAVYKLLDKYYDEVEVETVDNLARERRIDLERRERLLLAVWPKATAGDYKAQMLANVHLNARERILGYAAARKVELQPGEDGDVALGVMVMPMPNRSGAMDEAAWAAHAARLAAGEDAKAEELLRSSGMGDAGDAGSSAE